MVASMVELLGMRLVEMMVVKKVDYLAALLVGSLVDSLVDLLVY